MSITLGDILNEATFARLAGAYRRRQGIELYAADASGTLVRPYGRPYGRGAPQCDGSSAHTGGRMDACNAARARAIDEALRWGQPTVAFCRRRHMLWAVPVMCNQRVLGGLVASVAESRLFPHAGGEPAMDVRTACAELLRLSEAAGITNAALLASRRDEYRRQRDRAAAIEEFKLTDYAGVRWMYLQEEAALMAAIRRGDRPAAREILNRLLVAMIHRAGARHAEPAAERTGGQPAPLEVVKSFFVELVVMMCRTAVEAGNAPEELFGPDYVRLARVARARTEQDLSAWLRETLEGIMDAIGRAEAPPASQVITAALQHMRRHLDEPLSRDDVARAAHVSGPHFSRVFHRQTGRTFTQVLSRMRLDRAAWLLARTDKPIAAVALESGFADQSHFTKVFRRRFHETPRSYRRRLRPAPGES